jgi:CubicO group peptidase (beta-lactamase class C family)
MKLRQLIALAVTLLSAGCQATAAPQPVPDDRIASIDRFVKRGFAVGVTPGLGVAIVSDGRIVYTAALGHADVGAGIPRGGRAGRL